MVYARSVKKKMKTSDHEEITYRSTNARIVSDNMVVSVNLHWIRNIFIACIFLGTFLFKYEQRLRLAESRTLALEERVNELKSIHDAEIEEITKWYKKSVQVDLNPLNILKRKK